MQLWLIFLFTFAESACTSTTVPVKGLAASGQASVGQTGPKLTFVDGIVRVGTNHYEVDRATRDGFYQKPDDFTGGTRLVPDVEGKVGGRLRLVGVKAGGTLAALGFVEGDCLEVVNDCDVTVPEGALKAYADVRKADKVMVQVRRGEQPLMLVYDIK